MEEADHRDGASDARRLTLSREDYDDFLVALTAKLHLHQDPAPGRPRSPRQSSLKPEGCFVAGGVLRSRWGISVKSTMTSVNIKVF